MLELSHSVFVSSLDETVTVNTAKSFPIIFSGDQLTAARARSAKKAKFTSDSPSKRLEGLVPAVADWHTKQKILGVNNTS